MPARYGCAVLLRGLGPAGAHPSRNGSFNSERRLQRRTATTTQRATAPASRGPSPPGPLSRKLRGRGGELRAPDRTLVWRRDRHDLTPGRRSGGAADAAPRRTRPCILPPPRSLWGGPGRGAPAPRSQPCRYGRIRVFLTPPAPRRAGGGRRPRHRRPAWCGRSRSPSAGPRACPWRPPCRRPSPRSGPPAPPSAPGASQR